MIRLSPWATMWLSDYHQGQDDQTIIMGNYVMIRLSSWATMWWSFCHQGQLFDDQIMSRGKMIRLSPGATMWWSDYVQGQDDHIITRDKMVILSPVEKCYDQITSRGKGRWGTVTLRTTSALGLLTLSWTGLQTSLSFVFMVNLSTLYSSIAEKEPFSFSFVLIENFSARRRLSGTAQRALNRMDNLAQWSTMRGRATVSNILHISSFVVVFFYFCISLRPWLILMKNSKVIFLYCLILATLVDNDGKSSTEYFFLFVFLCNHGW